MKFAYGEFCSRHNEAVQLHKDILKNDRKYQNFIKKCSRNTHTKKLGITECILYVTQRMTKYPLLIEPIIKTTKGKIGTVWFSSILFLFPLNKGACVCGVCVCWGGGPNDIIALVI